MGSCFLVELSRDSLRTPWGFRLHGGAEYANSPLKVSRVSPLSAAEGSLCVGDGLVAVNGEPVESLTLPEATNIIANAGGTMRLLIRRGGPAAPAPSTPTPTTSTAPARAASVDPNEKPPIPTNSQLASIMTQSKELKMARPKNQIYRTMPGFFRGKAMETPKNITDFLPNVQKVRRSGSLGSHAMEPDLDRGVVASVLGSPGGSGRSSPSTSSLLTLGSPAPRGPANPVVGVWTPPTHTPDAKLVHSQYNSPIGMYSTSNVADMVKRQTGTKLKWERKPRVRFVDDFRESPTASYVAALDAAAADGRAYAHPATAFPQSSAITRMAGALGVPQPPPILHGYDY